MSAPTRSAPTRSSRRWIEHWDPEDETFWRQEGRAIARRNLWISILGEHIGFSVWTLWSVLVLFMGPEYGLSAADKFLLVSTPSLVGAVLRVPYTLAVARFGGRNWTMISAALLLIPTVLAGVVMQPGTPLWVFLLVAAIGGVGGGNFASSMTNINAFFPERLKGTALGLNAGGGNIGVAAIQVVGLLVISTAGPNAPQVLFYVYIPLIVVAVAAAALFMDNLANVTREGNAMAEVLRERDAYVMSLLYIGTFGSFIGYSFAFGLVLQNQFDRTPLQAAQVTFLGALLGSAIRPVGGWLADRIGGAPVTLWTFLGMAVGTVTCIAASNADSLALFVTGFIALFVLSGIGNGSTYKMIPAIFHRQALTAIDAGEAREAALARARRLSGALIGVAGAVGAVGGLLINLAFRESFAVTGGGVPAFVSFLAFYGVCFVVTWAVYLRRVRTNSPVATGEATPAGA